MLSATFGSGMTTYTSTPGYKRTYGPKRKRLQTKDYSAWNGMIDRCTNKNSKHYFRYGGRGITVCDAWKHFNAFHYWCIASGMKPGLSLDRIDNDGNYEPSNCRWATQTQQLRNTSRAKWFELNGETLHKMEWAARLGITYASLTYRLENWSLEDALTRPVSKRHQNFSVGAE